MYVNTTPFIQHTNYHSTAILTNLLLKWTDMPPVESENIQKTSSIKYIFLPRFITGQSCQCIYKNNIHVKNIDEHWGPLGLYWLTEHFLYLSEAEVVLWTAGCLYMTGWEVKLKTSPATWWRTDMLPSPEAKSSGSRCCPGSTDQEPYLQGNTGHC